MKKLLMLALILASPCAAAQVAPPQTPALTVTVDLTALDSACKTWDAVLGQADGAVAVQAQSGDRVMGLSVQPGTKVTFALLCHGARGTGRAAWTGAPDRPLHLSFQGSGGVPWSLFAGDVPRLLVR